MEFKKLISERKSCRSFKKDEVISEQEIREMISEALTAPTWNNTQSGRYYIALTPEKKAEVYNALPDFNQEASEGCGAYIITSFVKGQSGFFGGKQTDEFGEAWGAYDLGIQNAYLVLSAKDHGFDTLIMGLYDKDCLRKAFAIPEEEEMLTVIAVGKSGGELRSPGRKTPEKVSWIF